MLTIQDNVHISTVVKSLELMLKKMHITGQLDIYNLYLLDSINKLLNTLCLNLTNKQRRQLLSIYNNLSFKSKEICTGVMLDAYSQNMPSKFVQNFVDPEDLDNNNDIFYWKSVFMEETSDIITNLTKSFIDGQLSNTRTQFINGVNANVNGVGRICFFLKNQFTSNFNILDVLGNDISESFEIVQMSNLKGYLLVSKEMQISGVINFKIIFNG